MGLTYDGITYRSLEEQVRYDAEQVQLLKQADVTINENLQTVNTEIDGKLTKPANPSAESAVTMLADGTVGTKPLSEIGGGGSGGEKLYKHKIKLGANSIVSYLNFYVYNRNNTKLTLNDIAGSYFLASITGGVYSGVVSCIVQTSTDELATYKLITEGVVIKQDNAAFVLKGETQDYDISINDTWAEL